MFLLEYGSATLSSLSPNIAFRYCLYLAVKVKGTLPLKIHRNIWVTLSMKPAFIMHYEGIHSAL